MQAAEPESDPIVIILSFLNLERYRIGVILRFVGFGPPHQFHSQPIDVVSADDCSAVREQFGGPLAAAGHEPLCLAIRIDVVDTANHIRWHGQG